MGGITTGIGIFSGIDSASLIDQLITAQSNPLVLAQRRVIQLNQQQAAYLDINSRMSNFKTAAAAFRVNDIFSSRTTSTNNESVLTANATGNAVPGSYNFVVDRLVSTQQMLSRGFSDLDSSPVGIGSLTFESPAARLDADTALADLNDGDGIVRGKITVNGTEVDLSRAGTVQEVLDAISDVPGVNARVENDKFVLTGVTSISQQSGSGILESLGLDEDNLSGTTLTGTSVYRINGNTPITALNDGRGVAIRQTSGTDVEDFWITIDTDGNGIVDENDTRVNIRIGEIEETVVDDDGDSSIELVAGAVSTVGGVVDRINDALSDAGFTEFTASISTETGGIEINDSMGRSFDIENYSSGSGTVTTAEDLGLVGSYSGSASGQRILAGLNTKLVSSLNGGTGLGDSDGILNFTTRNGSGFAIDVSGLSDINDIINAINNDPGANGAITASVNSQGTGIQIKDNTTGGSALSITGTGGADTAEALGISGSFADGLATGSNLQLAYISGATLLSDLNNGNGIGTGTFEIVDSSGNRAEIRIGSSATTVADVLREINRTNLNLNITARINDNGDGIGIYEDTDGGDPGGQPIRITNISGSVATKLGIEGEATGTDGDNFIDGSFERVLEFEPDATLADIRNAIDAANVGVNASIINTGVGSAPFRLSLSSDRTGEAGRFLIDSGGFDLGLNTLDEGNDARVFFGSSDPASGVLLTSSVNQLDGVVEGVSINLHSRSDSPVELSVSTDTEAIETKIQEFIDGFNSVVEAIDFRTRYDQETEERGVLLGDGTLLNLRNGMFATIRKPNQGFTDSVDTLTAVGITVGSESKLEFDKEKFREAYASDPDAVEALFTRRELEATDDDDPNTIDEPVFTQLGVLGQIEEFADNYVTTVGGVLQSRKNALGTQIELQESRIESIRRSLDNKREVLQRQFLAMEQAIGAFQSQGSALAQLGSLG
ncbi:MAG: flagellar filament capping protein FliD [Phycisphaerales bacterium]